MNKYDLKPARLGIAIGSILAAGGAQSAAITVDTLSDTIHSSTCSLRAAVASANQGLAVGGCVAGSAEADSIVIHPSLSGTIELSSGVLTITNSLSISGPEANSIELTAVSGQRIFDVDFSSNASQSLSISHISLSGNGTVQGNGAVIRMKVPDMGYQAQLNLDHVVISAGTAAQSGGAVAFYTDYCGGLSIRNSSFHDNAAPLGIGGAIHASSYYNCPVLIENSHFETNQAVSGGALAITGKKFGPSLTMAGTEFRDNYAKYRGGGLLLTTLRHTELSIRDSGFFGNSAEFGGGLYVGAQADSSLASITAAIDATSFGHNYAEHDGAGLMMVIGSNSAQSTLDITDSGFSSNLAGTYGGGARLDLEHSVVSLANSALARNRAGHGGGLWFRGYDSDMTIVDTHLANNRAGAGGGAGLIVQRGNLEMRNAVFLGNIADYAGGGSLVLPSQNMRVSGSVFHGNRAINGAGMATLPNVTSQTMIEQSQFSANESSGSGGGLYAQGSGSMLLSNSTFSQNQATFGGGLSLDLAQLGLGHVTLVGNSTLYSAAADLFANDCMIENSLLALNPSELADGADVDLLGGCPVRYSLIGNSATAGYADGGGNLLNIDPMLEPLAINGNSDNPTLTHALRPGSPAIDAGDPQYFDLSAGDQRGSSHPRVSGGRTDIGAFEFRVRPDKLFRSRFEAPPH
jgi:hypothetical protein